MDKRNDHYTDWDDSVYGTGRTEPPKSRGGIIALMLILIIFLCGVITVLGILNIKLFTQLQHRAEEELSISVIAGETTAETMAVEADTVETMPPEITAETTSPMELQQSPASLDNVAPEGGMPLQDIYAQNIDSVVSISCILPGGSSTGTGVIFSDTGYIVTNAHVVEDAMAISAQLTDGRILEASLVGSDEISDLAVLRIQAGDLREAQFGDSSQLRIGDTVVAIGDPLGVKFRGTYTNGIISGIDRDVDVDGRTMTLIQTNAALNSGNSGGPLINCYGQVIGINTMKIGAFTDSAGVEGLGFAIPSATVKSIVDQIISQGYVSGRPTLGLEGDSLSTFYQHYYRMPAGLYITSVARGSDAYAKGVESGDLLLSVNDIRITSMEDLNSALFDLEVGQTVDAVIYRAGQQYLLELMLTEDKG